MGHHLPLPVKPIWCKLHQVGRAAYSIENNFPKSYLDQLNEFKLNVFKQEAHTGNFSLQKVIIGIYLFFRHTLTFNATAKVDYQINWIILKVDHLIWLDSRHTWD